MAVRTAIASGNINNSATWGATFVDGDDIVVGAAFTVTINVAVTLGIAGGAGTFAARITGNLNVEAATILRGDVNLIGAGRITLDRRGALTGSWTWHPPSAVTYKMVTSGAGPCTFQIYGESGDLVPITTNLASGGNRWYADFTVNPPQIDWDYFDILDLGGTGDTVATRAMSYTGASASSIVVKHGRIRTFGKLHFSLDINNFTFDFDSVDFRTARLTDCLQINNSVPLVTGTRRFLNCTFYDTAVRNFLLWCNDFTWDGCVLSDLNMLGDIQELNLRWVNCVFFKDVVGGTMLSGRGQNGNVIEECLFITASDNPHYVSFASGDAGSATPIVRTTIVDGCGFIGADAGDFWLANDHQITLDRILAINRAGSVFSVLGAGARVTMKRCTLHGVGVFANAGESISDAANLVRVSSNLFVSQPTGLIFDTLTAQTGFYCDYNGFFEQTNEANLDHPTLPGTPNSYLENGTWWATGAYGDDTKGQHDLYVDPQFSDPTVTCFSYYNAVLGSGATLALLRARMLELNGTATDGTSATFNTAFTRELIMAYLREGFTPQNPVVFGAGAPTDGTPSLGAIDAVPPPPPPQFTFPRKAQFRRRVIAGDAA